ncbi:MAG TPA: TetR/AcrR family transcriptional regulator [Stellaceae bacterium]|nr:TetR/AcrR family transcriptional regulator [Stellaceae bacterium]
MTVATDSSDTKTRILRIAERMFAERGFAGVSLRQLTTAAGVNLAAVNYHFGSKEGLLTAIFESRCNPMNEERLRRLEACAEVESGAPLLEQIVAAFIAPALASTNNAAGGAVFTRLRATLAAEQNELARTLVAKYFDRTSIRFITALARALPHLSQAEVFWRFNFLLGTLYYTMVNPARIEHLSSGLCDATDVDAVLAQMVPYAAAGFRAPGLANSGPRRTAHRKAAR